MACAQSGGLGMKTSEIASKLEAFGLPKEQARVYMELLRLGPSKASDLSPSFDWSRSKIYRVLEDLIGRGVVTKTIKSPTVFHPAPPQDLFELRRREIETKLDRVRSLRRELQGALEALKGSYDETEHRFFTHLEGAENIWASLRELFARAKRSVHVAIPHDAAAGGQAVVEDAWRILSKRREDAIDVRFLVHVDENPRALRGSSFRRDGARARYLSADEPFRFVIVDDAELVFWIQSVRTRMTEENNVAAHTNAPAVTAPYRSLFAALWTSSPPLDELGSNG